MKEYAMIRSLILGATGLAAAMLAVPASAQRWNDSGWRTIAYKTVNGRDTDIINAPGHTRQRAVRLCTINAPIHLRDFDIRFENGGMQDARTRAVLGAGRCTRAIDLRGNRRDIDRIRLRYEPIARGFRRPLIRVQVR
jgi:hypothetical protein